MKKAKIIFCVMLAIVLTISSFTTANATYQIEQQYAVSNKGVTDVYDALLALPNLGNVMYFGAHPDDENNALLAALNRGYKVDASYVVSNWGEGGDNWIGPELYGAIGVLRSQELLAARKYDRAKQYYIGAYDFGYSVSLNESLIDNNTLSPTYQEAGNWSWQIYAYNLARLIRLDRPDVFFSTHWGYGGHGQHQSCGYIAQKAYKLAADPTYIIRDYDGNILPAWQIKKLYASPTATYKRAADGSTKGGESDNVPDAPQLVIDTGEYDPILGMSYAEWGRLGRGSHKCQNVSANAPKGESLSKWGLKDKADTVVASDAATLFGGIDITYDRIFEEITSPSNQGRVKSLVNQLKSSVSKMINNFSPFDFLKIEDDIYTAMQTVAELERLIATDQFKSEPAVKDGVTQHWLDVIKGRLNNLAALIYGVTVDIISKDYDVVPGQTFEVTATAWVRTPGAQSKVTFPATAMVGIAPTVISVPSGWKVTGTNPEDIKQGGLTVGKKYVYNVTVPESYKDYTGPFNAPYDEYMVSRNPNFPYGSLEGTPDVWNSESKIAQENEINLGLTGVVNDPYSHSPIYAKLPFSVKNTAYEVEQYPELRVVPKVSLLINNENSMLKKSSSEQTATVNITVKNNMKTDATDLFLKAEAAGMGIDSRKITITGEGAEQTVTLNIKVPANYEGSAKVNVTAELGGEVFNEGFQVINYDHINLVNFYRAAIQNLTVADFAVADGLKVGYVTTGRDDFVIDFIKLMYNNPAEAATNVRALTPADLTNGADLKSKFDTIVIGKMAWSSIPDIQAKVGVLTDFANAGGNLVVHYQNATVNNNNMPLAPVPFPLGGTNINNENADVMMNFDTKANIEGHPFYYGIDLGLTGEGPYQSTSSVWNGWRQQRTEWTPGRTNDPIGELKAVGYETLFYGNDPGDTSTGRPAILYMPMENGGHYTYSAIVWERQLMDLVPGAYKLYANLLSMGKR